MNLPSPALIEILDQRFGNVWISHDGAQINVSCPFCPGKGMGTDNTGHLGLNFTKSGGVYHCVKCDAGGKGLGMFLEKNGISKHLYSLGGASLSDLRGLMARIQDKPVAYVPPFIEKERLPQMRRMRGDDFTAPTVWGESLLKKGISPEEAEDYALCTGYGKHEAYVIFPFFEALDDELPVYWQGRDATGQAFLRKLNPSVEECPQGKAHWLYGFEYAVRGCEVYLVEGTLDAISLQTWLTKHRGEGHVALGLQGTAFSFPSSDTHPLNCQYGKLASLKPKKVWSLLDGDAWKKSKELASLLSSCGFESEAVRLYSGDPNELATRTPDQLESFFSPANALRKALAGATY